jgi:hypothetical protein
MSTMLTDPGFYEMEGDDYHDDPAPEPSLSNSIGQILLERCPHAAWWNHPRLNPQFQERHAVKFDRGTVAHKLLLGKGKDFRIIEADDYRSKAAQQQRDAIREAGFVPVLVHHYQTAAAMATSARRQLKDIEGGPWAFSPEFGDIELCGVSRDPIGCWTRTLIDFCGLRVPPGPVCWDYKTTAGTAAPLQIKSHFNRMGWAFQAAFQERIITTLKPELAGRVQFRFLVQEDEEPYMCSVVEPAPDARTLAHKQVAAACAIWKACSAAGRWPGYPRASVALGVTAVVEAMWLSRELDDELVQLAANDPYLLRLTGWAGGESLVGTQDQPRLDRGTSRETHAQLASANAVPPLRKPRGPYRPRKRKLTPRVPPQSVLPDLMEDK